MDYYDDQKFDLGEEDFNDILEQDVFRPISASNMESSYMDTGSLYIEGLGCEDSSEADWLGGCLLDDPVVLNDRMISEAFHPAPITNEHSYSSMSNDSGMSSCDSSDDCATVSPAAATGTGGGTSDGVTCKPAVTTLVSGSSKMEHDSDNTDDDDDNSAMDYDHDKDLLHRAVCSIKEEEPDDNNSPAITTPNNSSSLPTTTSVAFTTTPTATLHAQQQQQQHTNHHRQAAIILTSTTVPATHQLHQQQHTNNNSNTANNNAPTAQQPYIKREPTTAHPQHHPQSLIVQPNIMVKVEPPVDTDYYDQPAGSPDSMMMPPTPPSSSTSDSEGGGYSPRRASPSSPLRITTPIHTHHHPTHHQYRINTTTVRQAPYATTNNHHTHTTTQPLFTNPIPQSGVLILSEEEKRTLITEGYPIPTKLPLTKQEERNLKKIRRKIKNKISAQESRRKKKEYVETLEKKMEAYSNENCDLRKKVDTLESNNRNLLSQLQKLQAIINGKIGKSVLNPQASTCVMVLVLCFAVFLGPWSPGELRLGSTHQSSLSVGSIAVGGGINGVHEYDGHVESSVSQDALYGPQSQDAYTTPNMRSRMLMSVIEEHGSDDLNFHQHDAQHASVIDPQKPSPDDTLSSSTLYFTGHDMSSSQDKLDVYVPGNNHDDRQSNSTDNDDRSSGHPGWSQDAAASAVVLDATVGAANATPPRVVSLDTRHIDGAHA